MKTQSLFFALVVLLFSQIPSRVSATGTESSLNRPIVMIDTNQAEEEYQALVHANPGRQVIRIPSLLNLKRPELQSFIMKRIIAEGTRLAACRSGANEICNQANKNVQEANAALSQQDWSFEAELKHQLSQISADVGSLYISGHYETTSGDKGGLIGKWGATNTKTISDLMKSNRSFDKTGFVGFLSCYFARDGMLQANFPIVNERSLMIVGYKGTGPLASNPEAAKYIKSFSDLDNAIAQPKRYSSTQETFDILKSIGFVNSGLRDVSCFKSTGTGVLENLLDKKRQTSKPGSLEACSQRIQGDVEAWLNDVTRSLDAKQNSSPELTLQVLHQRILKILEESTSEKVVRRGSGSSDYTCALALRDNRFLREVIASVDAQKRVAPASIPTKYKISSEVERNLKELLTVKDSMSLGQFQNRMNEIEDGVVSELQKQFKNRESYEANAAMATQVLAIKNLKAQSGLPTNYVDAQYSLTSEVESEVIAQRVAYYSSHREQRVQFLNEMMEKTFSASVPMSDFKEFGITYQIIRMRIRSELEALK